MTKREELNAMLDELIQAAYEKGLEDGKSSMLLVPENVASSLYLGNNKEGKSTSIPVQNEHEIKVGNFYESANGLFRITEINGDVVYLKNVLALEGPYIYTIKVLENPKSVWDMHYVDETDNLYGDLIKRLQTK